MIKEVDRVTTLIMNLFYSFRKEGIPKGIDIL